MRDGHIVTGVRHYSPDMRKTLRLLYPRHWLFRWFNARPKYYLQVKEQGFVDQYGEFLTREQAWYVAERQQQIRKQTGTYGTLYSEDLY